MYYKVLNIYNKIQGFITLKDFRFYHPQRKRMFMTTELTKAQYVIFNGQYYKVDWLAEAPELIGKYSELIVDLSTEEEYKEYLKKIKSE